MKHNFSWCSLSLSLSAKNEFNRLIKGQEMLATLNPYNGHCGKKLQEYLTAFHKIMTNEIFLFQFYIEWKIHGFFY